MRTLVKARVSRRSTLLVPSVIAGLALVFIYATYLSYYGARDTRHAFDYQEAVVAAQRDSELLERETLAGGTSPWRAVYAKLLASDLQRIDMQAQTPRERAPAALMNGTIGVFGRLELALAKLELRGRERFAATVARNERTRDLSNVLFAVVALLFVFVQARLRRRVEEGRTLVEGLQRAFLARRRSLPNVAVGTVLLSATRGSNVGGDVHDVFSFDGRHGMFLVADVSGKGLEAAVDTVFIKYSIRTLFSASIDPGVVLSRFGAIYARAAENPESFVVLFLGVIDTHTGVVRYASAGHEPAFHKSGTTVRLLPPTGPVVGIFPEERYATQTLELGRGDLIAVSTDGLTESRDAAGAMLESGGVARWLGELSADGSHMAEAIARRLRKRSRQIVDDLAILTIEYAPGRAVVVEQPPREEASRSSLVSTP